MDSKDLTTEQAHKLRESVARQLRYMNRLCARMQRLGFPVNDPLSAAALNARNAMQVARQK